MYEAADVRSNYVGKKLEVCFGQYSIVIQERRYKEYVLYSVWNTAQINAEI